MATPPGNSVIGRSIVILLCLFVWACGSPPEKNRNHPPESQAPQKVTFVELGSTRCIQCKKMQQVVASIREKYPDQVQVVFYDITTLEGKPFAAKYRVRLMPTQVFLNQNKEEFFRHEGYFSEKEVIELLRKSGVAL